MLLNVAVFTTFTPLLFIVDGPEPVKKDELAQVRLPMLQIILESGVDFHTVPLLIAEMAIKGLCLIVFLVSNRFSRYCHVIQGTLLIGAAVK